MRGFPRMKYHLFHFTPRGVFRALNQVLAGWKLCRETGTALRPLLPESVNSMTAAWNVLVTLQELGMPRPSTIVDVGANRSQMTKLLMRFSARDAKVFSFEPNPLLNPCGRVFRVALGDQGGEGSFVTRSADDLWGAVALNHPDAEGGVPVRTCRFDQLVEQEPELSLPAMPAPRLLKIDTEGFELRVLTGFGEILREMDYLLIEVENHPRRGGDYDLLDVASIVSGHGFNRSKVVYACYDGPSAPAYCDVFFWRKSMEAPHRSD